MSATTQPDWLVLYGRLDTLTADLLTLRAAADPDDVHAAVVVAAQEQRIMRVLAAAEQPGCLLSAAERLTRAVQRAEAERSMRQDVDFTAGRQELQAPWQATTVADGELWAAQAELDGIAHQLDDDPTLSRADFSLLSSYEQAAWRAVDYAQERCDRAQRSWWAACNAPMVG